MYHTLAPILAVSLGLTSITVAGQSVLSAACDAMRLSLRGVYFVPNHGQWSDDSVFYALTSRGLNVACRESSLTMHLSRERSEPGSEPGRVGPTNLVCRAELLNIAHDAPLPDASDSPAELEHLTLTITFPGSNPVTPRGALPQTARFNYFVAGEGRASRSDLPSYGAVVYEDLYDGIDLFVCGNDTGVLKYEFHVAPGADYSQIRIAYDGIDSLCVKTSGDLEIKTAFGTLVDKAPEVWHGDSVSCDSGSQLSTNKSTRERIPACFDPIDHRTYRILLKEPVDPTRTVIIDPDIRWALYLGGSSVDEGRGVAVDRAGSAFIAGYTESTDFEGRNNHGLGGEDAFVAKVNPDGQILWMTYVGGSGADFALAVTMDGLDNVVVAGSTSSPDLKRSVNSYHGNWDAFAAHISGSGQLLRSIYLGGSQYEEATGVAVDAQSSICVSGSTLSSDFEGRTNSLHGDRSDAYIVKVTPSGSVQWMVYLGGASEEEGWGLAVDFEGSALLTGTTASEGFEGRINVYRGGWDAFVAKVDSVGLLRWVTYCGGGLKDSAWSIAVDRSGSALVVGESESHDFERRNNQFHGGQWDAFVATVSHEGSLAWMTYLGGSGNEGAWGIAADRDDSVTVSGWTGSSDFEGAENSYHGGGSDAFVLQLSANGTPQWMQFVGGSGGDGSACLALDNSGNAIVGGTTDSNDFAGMINVHHGGADTFLAKIRDVGGGGPLLAILATCPSGGPIRIEWSGATPGGQVALIFARNTGSFIIPSNMPCAGTQLALGSDQIQLAWEGSAGPSGSRTLNATAGPAACGGHLQLLDLSPCATSNLVRIE